MKYEILDLRSVSELVGVSGDARHAGNAKVERIQPQSDLLREHNQEAAETRVHVDGNIEAEAERGDLRDRVHHSVRVLGRAHK